MQNRLLLIGADEALRRALHLLLRSEGFDVRAYARPTTVLGDAAMRGARHLVADHRPPQFDALALRRTLAEHGWAGQSVLLAAPGSAETLGPAARDCGYDAVLEMPLRPHALTSLLRGNAVAGTRLR